MSTIEDIEPDGAFETRYQLANRRLGYIQYSGSLADCPGLHDRLEGFQLA